MKNLQDLEEFWGKMRAEPGGSLAITGLAGGARAFVLAQLQRTTPRPLLIITSTPSEAERAFKDLQFFLPGPEAGETGLPELCLFPQWEILPYDDRGPHPEIVKERLAVLSRLLRGETLMVITTIRALMQRLLPRDVFRRANLDFRVGDSWDLEMLIEEMHRLGYRHTDLVELPGTFSRRGGILDFFPANQTNPIRMEFFGDEIESIRTFSPEDQRSFGILPEVQIILSREILLDPPAIEMFHGRIAAEDHFLASRLDRLDSEDPPDGVEFYAPLFYPCMETLLDYVPSETVVIQDGMEEIQEQAEAFHKEIEERYDVALHQGRSPCGTSDFYLSPEELSAAMEGRACLCLGTLPQEGLEAIHLQTVSIAGLSLPGKSRIASLAQAIREMQREARIVLSVRTRGQADRLVEILSREEQIPCTRFDRFTTLPRDRAGTGIVMGQLSKGFHFPLFRLACITEDEIFGVSRIHRPARQLRHGPFLASLSELKEGDYVVHLDHGIGRYRGLREVQVEGIERDLIRVEYKNSDLLYVPPEKMHLLQKYSGSEGHAVHLNLLGGTGWEKLKGRVKKSIQDMSRELVELYARRKMCKGNSFSRPDSLFREFEETFEYEETPDQQRAIEEVLQDMQKPEPMDRLVCGDVGFGKTEVALRASFKAALDGKQVAVLVPTTLLAQQHYDSFQRRLSAFPVKVDMLSRFKTRAEQKQTLKEVRSGQVDILVGTHRILSKDLVFKDLGLVIIDEEQRFGVRHKEKLKRLRTEVDVLTLTATPIPRTLEMAFLGIRDISIINTPPDNRLSIYTKVAKFSEGIVREAVLRELNRGGQVFFVHNRVMDIDRIAALLRKVVPEARLDVAHGQMEEDHLKEVMSRFVDREIDLMVATSIIQSGLDIPNANTMIIHRPEEFGLGQLYQLRGRIGRAHHRAYAYLLTRSEKSMTREARQRLQVIQELTQLGSGFQLAARDLEIRGAGNLLGPQQSGSIAAVGFDLYMQLADEVAGELKGEIREKPLEPSIQMRVSARIPKKYVREDRLRLDLYRRLASIDSDSELSKTQDEILDRFGAFPEEMQNLFRMIELRILARHLFVCEIQEQDKAFYFTFDPRTPVPRERIMRLIQDHPGRTNLVSEFQLKIHKPKDGSDPAWRQVKNLLQELI